MKLVRHYYAIMLLLPLLLVAACNNSKDENPRQLIAGENSKTWQASRETNAQGDKEKLSSQEKDQSMQFYSNGTFQIQAQDQFQSGRWNYNATQQELELTFEDNQDVKEVFHVQELSNDKMTLHAADGSTMQLKAQ